MLDYYKVLQIVDTADPEVIEAAYKRLIQKYHPDRNKEVSAKRISQLLNDAFSRLSDPVKRALYDEEKRAYLENERVRGQTRVNSSEPEMPQSSSGHRDGSYNEGPFTTFKPEAGQKGTTKSASSKRHGPWPMGVDFWLVLAALLGWYLGDLSGGWTVVVTGLALTLLGFRALLIGPSSDFRRRRLRGPMVRVSGFLAACVGVFLIVAAARQLSLPWSPKEYDLSRSKFRTDDVLQTESNLQLEGKVVIRSATGDRDGRATLTAQDAIETTVIGVDGGVPVNFVQRYITDEARWLIYGILGEDPQEWRNPSIFQGRSIRYERRVVEEDTHRHST